MLLEQLSALGMMIMIMIMFMIDDHDIHDDVEHDDDEISGEMHLWQLPALL